MTTSEAIEVLKLLSNYRLYHSLDSEQMEALDKAIEVMSIMANIETAIQDGLYATGKFTSEQCDQLTEGLMTYIKEQQ